MEATSQAGDGSLREELRNDASTVTGSAKQRLHSELDSRKGIASTQAKSISSALDAAAGELSDRPDWLRDAVRHGAQTLQSFADTIERKDSRQLASDVQQLARRNPATFLAGCALAGFAAARVLKAGADGARSSGRTSSQGYDPLLQPQGTQSGTAFTGMEPTGDFARQAEPSPAYGGEL